MDDNQERGDIMPPPLPAGDPPTSQTARAHPAQMPQQEPSVIVEEFQVAQIKQQQVVEVQEHHERIAWQQGKAPTTGVILQRSEKDEEERETRNKQETEQHDKNYFKWALLSSPEKTTSGLSEESEPPILSDCEPPSDFMPQAERRADEKLFSHAAEKLIHSDGDSSVRSDSCSKTVAEITNQTPISTATVEDERTEKISVAEPYQIVKSSATALKL